MEINLSLLSCLVFAELSECFSGAKPILLAGEFNAMHRDWNSRVNCPREDLLTGLPLRENTI